MLRRTLLKRAKLSERMDFHEAIAKLTRHPLFKEWHSSNQDFYLAHAFVMMDEANKDIWQIGFYNKKKERMVTFLLSPGKLEKTQEQEVLKSGAEIKELNTEQVKLDIPEALEKAKGCFKENYKNAMPLKKFFIIQVIEGHPTFNLTYFLQDFKTVNIKIDAGTGEIMKHSIQKLAEFG